MGEIMTFLYLVYFGSYTGLSLHYHDHTNNSIACNGGYMGIILLTNLLNLIHIKRKVLTYNSNTTIRFRVIFILTLITIVILSIYPFKIYSHTFVDLQILIGTLIYQLIMTFMIFANIKTQLLRKTALISRNVIEDPSTNTTNTIRLIPIY